MKVCYIITSGEYSIYTIEAIFDSYDLANAALPHYDNARIEEFPLNPEHRTNPDGLIGYQCYLWDRGEINPKVRSIKKMGTVDIGKVIPALSNVGSPSVYVWAKDHDHAIKIASEKFAQQRAIDAGIA